MNHENDQTTNNSSAEYAQVADNLRSGVSVLWDAFKTYFTVVGLMFAGCGFLFSGNGYFEPREKMIASLCIAIAGLSISVLGAMGVQRILAYQKLFLDRASELETAVRFQTFTRAKAEWERKTWYGSDTLTRLVLGIFGLWWACLAGYCIREILLC